MVSRQRSRRRWLVIGGIVSIAAGVLLAFVRPWSPPPSVPKSEAIPAEWRTPPAPASPPALEVVDADEEEPLDAGAPAATAVRSLSDVLPVGYVQAGRLVYDLDGRRVAEEEYRLVRRNAATVNLTSSGRFFFRVLFVTVSVSFDQEIEWGPDLSPRSYTLEARGPLGFGNQRIAARVEGGVATVTVGNDERELPLPEGNALFAGTLAAYVVLPALYAARAEDGVLPLATIGVATGPGGRSGASTGGHGTGELRWHGVVEVDAGGTAVVLDRYWAQTGAFGGTLLARGSEFVALLGEGERVLTAFRADLFPRGVGPLGVRR